MSVGSLAPQPSAAGTRLTVRESTRTCFVVSSRSAPASCTAHGSRLVARTPAKITRPPCGGKIERHRVAVLDRGSTSPSTPSADGDQLDAAGHGSPRKPALAAEAELPSRRARSPCLRAARASRAIRSRDQHARATSAGSEAVHVVLLRVVVDERVAVLVLVDLRAERVAAVAVARRASVLLLVERVERRRSRSTGRAASATRTSTCTRRRRRPAPAASSSGEWSIGGSFQVGRLVEALPSRAASSSTVPSHVYMSNSLPRRVEVPVRADDGDRARRC